MARSARSVLIALPAVLPAATACAAANVQLDWEHAGGWAHRAAAEWLRCGGVE